VKGQKLPAFSLAVPEDPAHRKYLGLGAGRTFTISQIQARVVIIEIFSMYCPYCQREAPEVNRLYRKIMSNPKLKDKVKLIGIGAGNSAFEVGIFRKRYDIPFPLIADADFTVHKCLGEVRTPYFIAVKIAPAGGQKVIFSKLGGIEGVDQFLNTIVERSGLDKED
jgi:peroxiredoxin